MKTYVLTGLNPAQLKKLKAAGISYFLWNKGTSILISGEESMLLALELLEATGTQTNAEWEDLINVRLTFNSAPAPQPAPVAVAPVTESDVIARSRENYVRACASRAEQLVVDAKKTVEEKYQQLPKIEARYVQYARQAFFSENRGVDMRSKFAGEAKALQEVSHVERVRVAPQGNHIYVQTGILHATAPDTGVEHELGKFLIHIEPDGSNGGIRFFNITRKVNGIRERMQAPYVFNDGRLMSDEIRHTFLELLARYEFAALVDLAIQFLETVNDDAAGRCITSWPPAQ